MSTPAEIEAQIAKLPPEQWLEVRLWMDKNALGVPSENDNRPFKMPDFEARRKAIFGDRVLPDSQAIFDEMRADHL